MFAAFFGEIKMNILNFLNFTTMKKKKRRRRRFHFPQYQQIQNVTKLTKQKWRHKRLPSGTRANYWWGNKTTAPQVPRLLQRAPALGHVCSFINRAFLWRHSGMHCRPRWRHWQHHVVMVTGARRNLDVNHAVFSEYLSHTSGQERFAIYFVFLRILYFGRTYNFHRRTIPFCNFSAFTNPLIYLLCWLTRRTQWITAGVLFAVAQSGTSNVEHLIVINLCALFQG